MTDLTNKTLVEDLRFAASLYNETAPAHIRQKAAADRIEADAARIEELEGVLAEWLVAMENLAAHQKMSRHDLKAWDSENDLIAGQAADAHAAARRALGRPA